MGGRGADVLIHEPEQWRALRSPLRIELIQYLRALGPTTVATLAGHLGRPASGVYYHVRRLVACGLVVESQTRAAGGRGEATFRLASTRFRYDVDGPSGRNVRELRGLCAAMLRMTQRDLRAVLASGRFRLDGPRANFSAGRRTAWLTPSELAQLTRYLKGIERLTAAARKRARARPYALTLFVLPMPMRTTNGKRSQS